MIYELVIEDENIDEVFAISLVEEPAIESNFVFFDKEKVQFAAVNDEKRLLMGPILIPDKQILRIDGEGMPYHVFFKPETIKRLSEMYLQKKYTDKSTLEHDSKIDGVALVESWIVESRTKDKSSLYGLSVPVGTWMGTFKVDNDDIWNNYVKTGEVKGFSIEGLFGHNLVSAAKEQNYLDKEISELEEHEAALVLSQIRALIKKDSRYKTKKRVEMESYSDYGSSVANNAKRGIELNEANGNKCATQVGKVRAQQLAQNQPISLETIKRMYSYLSRAEVYYDQAESNSDCGYISFLLWGGKSALSWSRNKLRELGALQENEAQPSIASTYPGQAASGSVAPALLAEAPNLDVYGYETKYFQICPGAQKTFTEIVSLPNDEEYIGMTRSAAVVADAIFKIENDVLEAKKATPQQLKEAILLVEDYKDIIHEIDEEHGIVSDVSYMDGHIKTIESFL
jgi:Putative phage serine protease XkdF